MIGLEPCAAFEVEVVITGTAAEVGMAVAKCCSTLEIRLRCVFAGLPACSTLDKLFGPIDCVPDSGVTGTEDCEVELTFAPRGSIEDLTFVGIDAEIGFGKDNVFEAAKEDSACEIRIDADVTIGKDDVCEDAICL